MFIPKTLVNVVRKPTDRLTIEDNIDHGKKLNPSRTGSDSRRQSSLEPLLSCGQYKRG